MSYDLKDLRSLSAECVDFIDHSASSAARRSLPTALTYGSIVSLGRHFYAQHRAAG
jgi:hypothetical protein